MWSASCFQLCPHHITLSLFLFLYARGPCYMHFELCSYRTISWNQAHMAYAVYPHMLILHSVETCNANTHNLRFCKHISSPIDQSGYNFIYLSCAVSFLSIKAYQQTSDRLSASVQFNKVMALWWFTNHGGRGRLSPSGRILSRQTLTVVKMTVTCKSFH